MDRPTRTASDANTPAATVARNRERGFALLLVLWTLTLVSFLIGRLAAAGSTEIRIAENLAANAAARTAADGAIYQAIFTLSRSPASAGAALGEVPEELRIGGSRIVMRIENEAARINPNFASSEVMAALIRVLGSDPKQAKELAGAIAEWVGRPQNQTIGGSGSQMADPGYQPPRAPLESIEELAKVRGMSPGMFGVLRRHLTLFGPGDPDPTSADPEVAAALALARGEPALENSSRPNTGVGTWTFRIHARAEGPRGALVTRTAVVRFDAQSPNGFGMLAWYSTDESYE